MTNAIVLASALLIGGATFDLSGETAIAAGGADAMKKERCERDAMLHRYMGKQRSRFIKQCLASSNRLPGKAAARPSVPPSGPTAIPRITPLGGANLPSTSTGSTAPSNAPVAPSAPVIGSTGTSTTGSSAT
jgi:hypothetical protein